MAGNKIAKLLILLVVSLAVPLQDAAAVSDLQCMALGHHDMPGEISHEEDRSSAAHIGSCVICSASVSIADSVMVFSLPASGRSVEQVPYPFLAGVPPDELDRPPLSL